jgi:hypothetical protein
MRRIHLVGTLGSTDYPKAAKHAVDTMGKYITTLPADEPANGRRSARWSWPLSGCRCGSHGPDG